MRRFIPKFNLSLPKVKIPSIGTTPVRKVTDALLWTPRKIGWVLRKILHVIATGPDYVFNAIIKSPRKAFMKAKTFRDWLLEKIDYLESESAKWKRTFQIIKSPYTILLKMGFSPQYAIGLLAVGTTATTGVVANEALKPPSFAAGDPGVYNAPLDSPIYSAKEFNTLRLDLGATPIGLVQIEDITVGTAYANSSLPSGETNAVIIGGIQGSNDPAFTETYLEVGHLTVEKWRCDSLKLTNVEAHELVVKGNASDGQSIAATAGTPRDRAISGGNRADDMITSGGYYDQLKITSASSGVNGKIDRLILSNIYTRGGPCILDRIKAGTVEILVNEVGEGDGFSTKEFEITTSVVYKRFVNEDNIEVSISPPTPS